MTDTEKFECIVCKGEGIKQDSADTKLTNDTATERVETLCYLGDMLSSDGRCDHAVISQMNKVGISLEN